jgi:hypothetical protein
MSFTNNTFVKTLQTHQTAAGDKGLGVHELDIRGWESFRHTYLSYGDHTTHDGDLHRAT